MIHNDKNYDNDNDNDNSNGYDNKMMKMMT